MLDPTVPYEFILRDMIWRYHVIPEILWQPCPTSGWQLNPSPGLIQHIAIRIGDWTDDELQQVMAGRNAPDHLLNAVAATISRTVTLRRAVATLLCIMGEIFPPRPPVYIRAV